MCDISASYTLDVNVIFSHDLFSIHTEQMWRVYASLPNSFTYAEKVTLVVSPSDCGLLIIVKGLDELH